MVHRRHTHRTCQWGNWGITFYNPQPDLTLNYGILVASIDFACGPQGPIDGYLGSPLRESYKKMCRDWTEHGILPESAKKAGT